jgi:hypothetical protein
MNNDLKNGSEHFLKSSSTIKQIKMNTPVFLKSNVKRLGDVKMLVG